MRDGHTQLAFQEGLGTLLGEPPRALLCQLFLWAQGGIHGF